jgi:hypothetical protein
MKTLNEKLSEIIIRTTFSLTSNLTLAITTIDAFTVYVQSLLKEDPPPDRALKDCEFILSSSLPINSMINIVVAIEAMFNDILRAVLLEYPVKVPADKEIKAGVVMKIGSLVELKECIVEGFINEVLYQSPEEYAKSFEKFVSVSLKGNKHFAQFQEIKAARDIYIHNKGIVNDVYLKKAGSLAKGTLGKVLDISIHYYVDAQKACMELVKYVSDQLNKTWPLSEEAIFEVTNG